MRVIFGFVLFSTVTRCEDRSNWFTTRCSHRKVSDSSISAEKQKKFKLFIYSINNSLESAPMTAVTLIKELCSRFPLLWFSRSFWNPNPIGVVHLMRLCASQTLFYVISFWCRIMHLGLVSSPSNCLSTDFD